MYLRQSDGRVDHLADLVAGTLYKQEHVLVVVRKATVVLQHEQCK